jgi:hypothetical protein
MQRVHIVGSPRTGTSLMLELMLQGFGFERVMRQEIDILRVPSRLWRSLLTKRPRDHVAVESLLRVVQDHWFIFMQRDPRDVVVSRHPEAPDAYWANLPFWRAAVASIAAMREHPQLIVVRYEQLVTEPDRVQRQIAERLPFLPVTGSFSRFQAPDELYSSQRPTSVRKSVESGRVGRWREHKARLAGQLRMHGSISQELISWGYEQDEVWLSELAGVEPDLTQSHVSDDKMDMRISSWRREATEKLPTYLRQLQQLRAHG